MLLSSESMMNLHYTFLHSSQTHATPVPAAALAPSVASFLESPPSGCAQYYFLPTKYREITGWVFWCSWKHKENGICSLFVFFLSLGSEKPYKKQFKFLNPALYVLSYFWTQLSAFKTNKQKPDRPKEFAYLLSLLLFDIHLHTLQTTFLQKSQHDWLGPDNV